MGTQFVRQQKLFKNLVNTQTQSVETVLAKTTIRFRVSLRIHSSLTSVPGQYIGMISQKELGSYLKRNELWRSISDAQRTQGAFKMYGNTLFNSVPCD